MTSTELILEAVEYSLEEGMFWWEVFETKTEASKVLTKALREEPDDHQIASLIAYKEEYIDESLTVEENYIYILKKLRKELKETAE